MNQINQLLAKYNPIQRTTTILLLALLIVLPFAHTAALQSFLYVSAFLLTIYQLIKNKQKPFFLGLGLPIALFSIAIVGSAIISIDWHYSFSEIKGEFLTYLLIYLLVITNIKKETVPAFLFCLTITATVMSIYGIIEYFFFINEPFPRADSLMTDYNFLSTYLGLVLPMPIYLFTTSQKKSKKYVFALSFILILWCLLLTYSRGAWIAAILILFLFALFKEQKLLIIFFLLLVGLSFLAPKKLLEREKTLIEVKNYTKEATILSRLQLWQFGLSQIKKSPFLGNGYGRDTFIKKYPDISKNQPNWHTHNLFIDTTLELGIIGLLTFLFLFFTILKKIFTLSKKTTNENEKMLLFCLGLSIMGFLTRCFFDYLYVANLARILWFLVGLGMLHSKNITQEKNIN